MKPLELLKLEHLPPNDFGIATVVDGVSSPLPTAVVDAVRRYAIEHGLVRIYVMSARGDELTVLGPTEALTAQLNIESAFKIDRGNLNAAEREARRVCRSAAERRRSQERQLNFAGIPPAD